VGDLGYILRPNATVYDSLPGSFSFTSMTLTWTWPQIGNDPGVVSFSDVGGGDFSFYTPTETLTPFVTLEAAPAAAPEPATSLPAGFALAAGLARRWRKRRA
jgi:hypothetical protein